MSRHLPPTLITIMLVLAGGCGTVSGFMPLNPPPHELRPRQPSEVEMFTSSKPDRRYVEVGLVTAAISSTYSGADTFEVMNAVRAEAAKHGCEAVIIQDEQKVASGTATHGTYASAVNVSERTGGFRAVCIVYNDPPKEVAGEK